MTTQPHLSPRLKKEYSYVSTSPVGLHGSLWGELYHSSTNVFNSSNKLKRSSCALRASELLNSFSTGSSVDVYSLVLVETFFTILGEDSCT